MTSSDAKLNTLGMSGDYNKHSSPQRMALEPTFPALEDSVKQICNKLKLTPESTFVVADYGSSHGGNSIKPMSIVIESARRNASPNQPIAVYHTDLPHNDYNALFRTVLDSESSYMKYAAPNAPVMSLATATPFFQQILPSSSVHLGFSSSSVHWLSCFPSELQHLYSVAAPEPLRALWREQAAVDYKNFLQARYKELVPGGMLVLSNLFMDDDGYYTTKELGDVMDGVISEMLEDGVLDQEAARRFSHPTYFRTREEYIAPLAKHNFTLRDSFSRHVPNPIYQECEETGSFEGFGAAMVAWAKQWAHVALLRAVSHLQDEVAKAQACEYFYRRVEEEVNARPHDHDILMVMLYVVAEKNSCPAPNPMA